MSAPNSQDDKLERLHNLVNSGLKRKLFIYKYTTITLATLLLVAVGAHFYRSFGAVDPADFMMVYSVTVPDHKIGEDPNIVYHRNVLKGFRGHWTVDLRHYDSGLRVDHCKTGNGVDSYEVGAKHLTMRLRFYAGWSNPQDCMITAGCYFLETTWHIYDMPNVYVPPIINRTNRFCVN